MKILPAFISEELVKALGWTILHSLWQGTVLGLVLAVLLVLLHRQSATIRYIISSTTMLMFLLLAISTFIFQYRTFTSYSKSSDTVVFPIADASGFPVELMADHTTSTVQHSLFFNSAFPFTDYFNQHLPVIVLVWLMGMVVLLLRYVGGLAYIKRLKNYKNRPLSPFWQERLQSLSQQMKINQSVRLVESALVKVPLVIGLLKPVILLPVGAVAGLPVQQVEAILAHELAHIYRKDYLVNLLQCLIEVVFFYHPCVWWVSARMREEREHCCDDMAITICADSLTFAKALTNLQYMKDEPHRLAVAITGKKNYLLYRIKRLGNGPRRKLDPSEGFAAALFLVVSLLVVSVNASSSLNRNSTPFLGTMAATSYHLSDQVEENNNQIASRLSATEDSTRTKGRRTFTFMGVRNNKNYNVSVIMNADTVTELYVDGKRISNDKIPEYRELIEDLTADVVEPLEPVEPAEPVEPIEIINEAEPVEPADVAEVIEIEPAEPVEPDDFGHIEFWSDTTKSKLKGKTTIIFDGVKGNKKLKYKILMEDGLLKELYVDGKRIPDNKIAEYDDLIDNFINNSEERHADAMLRQEEARIKHEEMRKRQEELRRQHEEIRREQNENRERMLREQEQIRREIEIEREKIEKIREERDQRQKSAMIEREKSMRERAAAMAKREEANKKREELIDIIQKEFIKDKLIKNKNQFEFRINTDGLYIDQVKQPEATFEKYKKIVEQHTGKNLKNFNMEFKVDKKEK